jgi:GNAT superfamily N-acetyltransferase
MSDSVGPLFDPYPKFRLERNDLQQLRRLRALEPGLVSSIPPDHQKELKVLGLYHQDQALGAVSFFCLANAQRKTKSNRFGRIDLVIADPAFRGHGVGRLLILCSLLHLFDEYHGRIYSISCLAAHVAVKKVLEDMGFISRQKGDENFTHEEFPIGSLDEETALRGQVQSRAEENARSVNYRLTQIALRS